MTYTGPETCRWTACHAVEQLRLKKVSPQELLSDAMARIDVVEPDINAIVTRCEDRARGQIDAGLPDYDGPGALYGLPIAIKDLNAVSGVRTTFATKGFADFIPETSDPLVRRLEDRGAVIAGKTNTPEMGAGGNSTNAVFGATRNPWDTSKNAGGSSGGAAASLATGEVWLSHGSDLAGSIRTPAAYCGVVGLRTSPGRAGGGPALSAFQGEALSGPMARNVADCALFLDAMTGFDPEMPLSIDAPKGGFQAALSKRRSPLRIAFSLDMDGFGDVEPEIEEVLSTAMQTLSQNGATIDTACPDLSGLERTYTTLRGMHYATLVDKQPDEIKQHFKETLRLNIEGGLAITTDDIYAAFRDRTTLYHTMRVFLEDWDVLATAVVGIEPGPVEEEYPRVVKGRKITDYVNWLRFSFLSVVTTLPAISIPVGFTKSGMPVGLQLIGKPRGEAALLVIADEIEQILGIAKTLPIDPIRGPVKA